MTVNFGYFPGSDPDPGAEAPILNLASGKAVQVVLLGMASLLVQVPGNSGQALELPGPTVKRRHGVYLAAMQALEPAQISTLRVGAAKLMARKARRSVSEMYRIASRGFVICASF